MEQIINNDTYRGQIAFVSNREEHLLESQPYDLYEPLFNPYSLFKSLYMHQLSAINALKSDENVLVSSAYYSGKSSLAIMWSLDKYFNQGGSSLIIVKGEHERKVFKRFFNECTKKIKIDWLINLWDLSDETDGTNISYTGIYLCELKDLHSKILPNAKDFKYLFDTINLVIIDDLDEIPPKVFANLHFIIKRLKTKISNSLNERQTQYLCLSQPFANNKTAFEDVLQLDEIVHVSNDTSPIKSGKIYTWVPPLNNIRLEKDENFKFHFIRKSLIEEGYNLLLNSVNRGKNTLLFFNGYPYAMSDLRHKEDELKTFSSGEQKGRYFVGSNLAKIHHDLLEVNLDWENVDVIILSGYNNTFHNVWNKIKHIGSFDSEIYLLVPQLPENQFLINIQINLLENEISVDKNLKVLEPYYLYDFSSKYLYNKHISMMLKENSEFGDDEITNIISSSFGQNLDADTIQKFRMNKIEEIIPTSGLDIYCDKDLSEAYTVIDLDISKILKIIDKEDIALQYYTGSVFSHNDKRYLVKGIDDKKREISVTEENEFGITYPLSKIDVQSESSISSPFELISRESTKISFEVLKLTATVNCGEYYQVSELDVDLIANDTSFSKNKMVVENIDLNMIKICDVPINIVHSFTSAFLVAVRDFLLINTSKTPKYFVLDDNAYIYNIDGLCERIYDMIFKDTIMEKIINKMYQTLIQCPCSSGCPGCIHSLEIKKDELSKIDLIKYLDGFVNSKSEATDICRRKTDRVANDSSLKADTEYAMRIRKRILEILEYKLGMEIINKYDFTFVPNAEKEDFENIAGMCVPSKERVYVQPILREELFIYTLTHEYIHNWQNLGNFDMEKFSYFNENDIDDPKNILFGGKLFLEGQAQWASAKLIDFWGLKNLIYDDISNSYGEYYEGSLILFYLEKSYGITGIISKLKGNLSSNELEYFEQTLSDWYENSQLKSSIQGRGLELYNEGNLICLGKNYLDKITDIGRISYFMSLRHRHSEGGHKLKECSDEELHKLWEKLKPIVKKNNPKFNNNMPMPCFDCKFKDNETIESMCTLFQSRDIAKSLSGKS